MSPVGGAAPDDCTPLSSLSREKWRGAARCLTPRAARVISRRTPSTPQIERAAPSAPTSTKPSRLLREATFLGVGLAAALLVTWPLATVFATRICGDVEDPYQTLWGMRWFRDALMAGRDPFFTDRLFHPFGTTLRLHAIDLPSTFLVLPLWGWLSELAIYNFAVIVALTVAAYGIMRLVHELTGDALVAAALGALSLVVPYQSAHLRAHLYYVSTGWLALYVTYLVRVLRGDGGSASGINAGVALAIAALTSWYYVVFAAVVTLVLGGYELVRRGFGLVTGTRLGAAAALVLTFGVLVAPILLPMLRTSTSDDFYGAHNSTVFSADAYALVVPNVAQWWGDVRGGRATRWSGNPVENGNYVGMTMLILALVGARRAAAARPFLVLALVGATLSLGPFLRLDGRVTTVRLPYGYLEERIPALAITGVPVRFGHLMYLGLIGAAAFGLVRLRTCAARAGRAAGHLAVVVPIAIAAVEYLPRTVLTSAYALPPPLRAWADDPAPFAVLDAWDEFRPMWHATIHRKPIVGGYLARVPRRLMQWRYEHPVVRSIVAPDRLVTTSQVDPSIDFAWRGPNPGALAPGPLQIGWGGSLLVPVAGSYDFWLVANDQARLAVDGREVATIAAPCPAGATCESKATVALTAGAHRVNVTYTKRRDDADVHLAWAPPGRTREIVPHDAWRTARGEPGIDASYAQRIPRLSGLGRDAGRQALRDLAIRYVITRTKNACVEAELALPLVYDGQGVRIYEVPAVS